MDLKGSLFDRIDSKILIHDIIMKNTCNYIYKISIKFK